MDFGVLDGLMCSGNNNKSTTLASYSDLDPKPKWYGSGGGFCKQERSVSAAATHEDEWRDLKMAKNNEDDFSKAMLLQQQRSNYFDAQNMLSFSSPNTQTVPFAYYARNTTGYATGGPFTPSQWMELEHQALIYKYITANAAIPSNLLIPIRKALETAAFSAYSGANLRHNTFGWNAFHLGFCNSSDPEPGRCRRTDGKKWRCAKDAVIDQKYCERHMNRGRHRSRKPVEGQTGHSVPTRPATATIVGAAKLSAATTSPTILSQSSMQAGAPKPTISSQDNRSALNKATMVETALPMLSSSSIVLKRNQHSTPKEPLGSTKFGVVCSDSLLNPLQKRDTKYENSLHQFMDDWPHSDQAQLSISIPTVQAFSSGFVSSTSSPTSERLSLSPLRMGLGMGNITNTQQASGMRLSWETSMGGPLGEVLQHSTNNSPSGLNLMSNGWDSSPQMASSPRGLS